LVDPDGVDTNPRPVERRWDSKASSDLESVWFKRSIAYLDETQYRVIDSVLSPISVVHDDDLVVLDSVSLLVPNDRSRERE